MTEIIGKGEVTLVQILLEMFPRDIIRKQVKLKELLKGDFKKTMSLREEKETVDVVLYHGNKTYAIRVMGRDHLGTMKSEIDRIQKRILEMNKCIVIDIWYYEAKELFRDKNNANSREEVKWILKQHKIEV